MKSKRYDPHQYEQKWREAWESKKIYKTDQKRSKKKIYTLVMFPYPSGAGLHIGHVRIYTGTDVLARFFRMKGYSVLHPMGWDAFGLPAENAAIKAKKNPIDMVATHITNFKGQMMRLGLSYDWDKELATCDPSYYAWTQWLFIQFFKMGLLYKKKTAIYFCPSCQTGLADEEVVGQGTHERCGSTIIRKELPQWIFRITSYAEELLAGLEGLDWPEGIKEMQRQWIGKKEGAEIEFKIYNSALPAGRQEFRITNITVFTTRPDTIFGVTGLVIAPEHELVEELINDKAIDQKKRDEIAAYITSSLSRRDLDRTDLDKEKTGVFSGIFVLHPITGKEIPLWIADYVLGSYGSGAVMLVPGHDERDFEFARRFKVNIEYVVRKDKESKTEDEAQTETAYEGEGIMINSQFLNGLTTDEARRAIVKYLEEKKIGKRSVSYHLRDWIFSRQRYWGEPIPMIYCQNCGWIPVKEEDLPIKLPYVKSYEPTHDGSSPLSQITEFVNTTCPNCGEKALRETDTMPNWAGSCWYFLAFALFDKGLIPSPSLKNWNKEKMIEWLPVSWYLGGAEHAVLHLLYTRFWIKALQKIKLVDFTEPFTRLRSVGIVIAQDHRKMSKSFGNVVNPDEVVKEYGADTLRLYEMFMAPFSSEVAWSDSAIQGCFRFLSRIYQIYHTSDKVTEDKNNEDKNLYAELQRLILKVSSDITHVKFNTAIAAMMGFVNKWEKGGALSAKSAEEFLQIVSPFAPFIAEELWTEIFKHKDSIHLSSWSHMREKIIEDENLSLAVQINGKTRAVIKLSKKVTHDQKSVVSHVLENTSIQKRLEGKTYRVIYVKEKVLNFVTN